VNYIKNIEGRYSKKTGSKPAKNKNKTIKTRKNRKHLKIPLKQGNESKTQPKNK